MKNLGIKLWSLVIALALFSFVNSQSHRGVMTLIVPLEVRNLPPDKVVLIPNLNQIQVTVRGPSYLLSGLAASPPSYIIRMPADVGNRHFVSLQANALAIPPTVEVLSIEPPEIEYVLDDLAHKQLRVIVPRIGNLHGDLEMTSMEVSPTTVSVRGPSTEVQNLETIETAAIDLREITESSTRQLSIRVPGRFLRTDQSFVEVKIEVKTVEQERTFRDVPVRLVNKVDESVSLSPERVMIEVSGPRSVIESLSSTDLLPFVDFSNGVDQSGKLPVQVRLPERVSLVIVEPQAVEVGSSAQ